MASRPKKSEIILLATSIANVDGVDVTAPGGAAYAAHMLRVYSVQLQLLAGVIEDGNPDLLTVKAVQK